MNRTRRTLALLALGAVLVVGTAQIAPGLITFHAGDAVKADEINHNFTWLDGRIDGVQDEVTTLAATVDAIEIPEAIVGAEGPQGPQGPQGLQGVQGEPGVQGETGPIGPTGPQGETGLQGIQGVQGEAGATGATGLQGEQGLQGIQGIAGPRGEIGPVGPQGLQGERGLAGAQGEQGIQGEVGPQGQQGIQGLQGLQGASGKDGANGLDGATGPMGPQGIQGETGPAGPKGDPGLGATLSIVTLTSDVWMTAPSGPAIVHLRNVSGVTYTAWTPMGTSIVRNGNTFPAVTEGSHAITMSGNGSLITLFYADGVYSEGLSHNIWYGMY